MSQNGVHPGHSLVRGVFIQSGVIQNIENHCDHIFVIPRLKRLGDFSTNVPFCKVPKVPKVPTSNQNNESNKKLSKNNKS